VLATQMAHLGASGELREGTVIDVTECIRNVMEGNKT
jgi:hypothetical protein